MQNLFDQEPKPRPVFTLSLPTLLVTGRKPEITYADAKSHWAIMSQTCWEFAWRGTSESEQVWPERAGSVCVCVSLSIPHQADLFIWESSSICLSHHSSFIWLLLSRNNFLFCSSPLFLSGCLRFSFAPFQLIFLCFHLLLFLLTLINTIFFSPSLLISLCLGDTTPNFYISLRSSHVVPSTALFVPCQMNDCCSAGLDCQLSASSQPCESLSTPPADRTGSQHLNFQSDTTVSCLCVNMFIRSDLVMWPLWVLCQESVYRVW